MSTIQPIRTSSVVTVTPNPSLDHTLEIDRLSRGEVHRSSRAAVEAGGKGVNVARALARHGRVVTAILPAGADGAAFIELLAPQRVYTQIVPVNGAVRNNITIVEADGTTTKFNEPGATLGPAELDALQQAIKGALQQQPEWLVGSGSLPGGAPPDYYAQLVELASGHGVGVAVDTSGVALTEVARSPVTVIKPNLEELAELQGGHLQTVGDVVDAANELRAAGPQELLISLGSHGALLVTAAGSWWAGGPELVPRSTVGAGDSTLSGYLHTTGSPAERLAAAVSWGRAAVLLPGSQVPGPEECLAQSRAVRVVTNPDRTQPVKDVQQ